MSRDPVITTFRSRDIMELVKVPPKETFITSFILLLIPRLIQRLVDSLVNQAMSNNTIALIQCRMVTLNNQH